MKLLHLDFLVKFYLKGNWLLKLCTTLLRNMKMMKACINNQGRCYGKTCPVSFFFQHHNAECGDVIYFWNNFYWMVKEVISIATFTCKVFIWLILNFFLLMKLINNELEKIESFGIFLFVNYVNDPSFSNYSKTLTQ